MKGASCYCYVRSQLASYGPVEIESQRTANRRSGRILNLMKIREG
jgi:hypothetical protein